MWTGESQRILQWLSMFDVNGWQERWEAARGNDLGWVNDLVAADCPPRGPVRSRDELLRGLRALLYLHAIRPSYIFFLNYHPSSLYDLAREVVEPAAFHRCYETGKTLGFSWSRLNDGMRTIVRMVLHTAGSVADLREADFLEMRDEHRRAGRPLLGTAPTWDILGALGILTESRSFLPANVENPPSEPRLLRLRSLLALPPDR